MPVGANEDWLAWFLAQAPRLHQAGDSSWTSPLPSNSEDSSTLVVEQTADEESGTQERPAWFSTPRPADRPFQELALVFE